MARPRHSLDPSGDTTKTKWELMSSLWDHIRYAAIREGWGAVIGWWAILTLAVIGAWQLFKWLILLWWWISGQTPPSELLDL